VSGQGFVEYALLIVLSVLALFFLALACPGLLS
jgi:hypothetical protein